MNRVQQLVLHAHCYQPPRENPWTNAVPLEPSAAPDHDWNARITRECYAPLGKAPVFDGESVRRVINAWEWISFDVGPTLVRWLEPHAPQVLEAMIAGDRAAIARTGRGTAIAAPRNHVILPLASRRDKEAEVREGIRDFVDTFGREPMGIWLPETAVDEETLDVIADAGIRFTILAPHQVSTPDPLGAPLRWRNGPRELLLLPYHGALSHGVAFGALLTDAPRWHDTIRSEGTPLTVIATDGETFGHHHRFGDLALAALIDRIESDPAMDLVPAELVASGSGDQAEAHLIPDTSWSCPHGLGRWKEDCGCRMDEATHQRWRAPLRAALQQLSERLIALAPGVVPDPQALDHHRRAMFTSCGWFFDDLARIEPRIVLRQAARGLDFVAPGSRDVLEGELLATLSTAEANDPSDGTGATIWREILAERGAD